MLGTDGGGESDPRRTAPDINATGMVRRVDAFLSPLPRVQVRATEEARVRVCVCVYSVVIFALLVLLLPSVCACAAPPGSSALVCI